jgi:transglutaminase-like putative cysteine protease
MIGFVKIVILFGLVMSNSVVMATTARKIEFVQEFRPSGDDKIELWIPTPMDGTGYQRLISREFVGNASIVRIGSNSSSDVPFIYARWDGVKNPQLKITNIVEVNERLGPLAGVQPDKRYLDGTAHVQVDGIVKQTSDQITAGLKDDDRKARAIYDWIVDKSARDPDVRGCGLGDVKTTLTSGSLRGKCADLNSLFVGLARAAGIPAREVFGQRVAESIHSPSLGKTGDNSKAQHCRAEYFSKITKGWVPVDPADVRKLILEEKLAIDHPRVKEVREKFFGYWENNWVAFNFGRDFVLDGFADKSINYFMYPLLIAGKVQPDGIDPIETGYAFKSMIVN